VERRFVDEELQDAILFERLDGRAQRSYVFDRLRDGRFECR